MYVDMYRYIKLHITPQSGPVILCMYVCMNMYVCMYVCYVCVYACMYVYEDNKQKQGREVECFSTRKGATYGGPIDVVVHIRRVNG